MPKKADTVEPVTSAEVQAWADSVNWGFKLSNRLDQAEKLLEQHARNLSLPWEPWAVELPEIKGVTGRGVTKAKRKMGEDMGTRTTGRIRFGPPGKDEEVLIDAAFRLKAARSQMESGNPATVAVHCLFLGEAIERLRNSVQASQAAKKRSRTRRWKDPMGDLDRAFQQYLDKGRSEKPQAGDLRAFLESDPGVSDSTFEKRVSEWRKIRSDRQ